MLPHTFSKLKTNHFPNEFLSFFKTGYDKKLRKKLWLWLKSQNVDIWVCGNMLPHTLYYVRYKDNEKDNDKDNENDKTVEAWLLWRRHLQLICLLDKETKFTVIYVRNWKLNYLKKSKKNLQSFWFTAAVVSQSCVKPFTNYWNLRSQSETFTTCFSIK